MTAGWTSGWMGWSVAALSGLDNDSRPGFVGRAILGVTGMIQTIPSIALLMLLIAIPFLGIGITTAIVALFLYSLLPIVRR
jgi:osmoprotectant transport system permease protein